MQIGRIVLDEAARSIRVGMTTDEIDRIVHEVNDEHGSACDDHESVFFRVVLRGQRMLSVAAELLRISQIVLHVSDHV